MRHTTKFPWASFGIVAVCIALFFAVGCTLEELTRTEKGAELVVVASTQPSATDMLPFGTEIKLAAGLAALAVLQFIRKLIKDKTKAERIARQVIIGVEEVLPEKTDEQKLKLAAAQADEDTKKFVSEVKGD